MPESQRLMGGGGVLSGIEEANKKCATYICEWGWSTVERYTHVHRTMTTSGKSPQKALPGPQDTFSGPESALLGPKKDESQDHPMGYATAHPVDEFSQDHPTGPCLGLNEGREWFPAITKFRTAG